MLYPPKRSVPPGAPLLVVENLSIDHGVQILVAVDGVVRGKKVL
jgi:hypothetical protein